MNSDRSVWSRAFAVLAGLGLLVLCVSLGGAGANRAKVQVRSGLAQTPAEQVEDGRRHGVGRG